MEKSSPVSNWIDIDTAQSLIVSRIRQLLDETSYDHNSYRDLRTLMLLLYPPTRSYLLGLHQGFSELLSRFNKNSYAANISTKGNAQKTKLHIQMNPHLRGLRNLLWKIEADFDFDLKDTNETAITFHGLPIRSKILMPHIELLDVNTITKMELRNLADHKVLLVAISPLVEISTLTKFIKTQQTAFKVEAKRHLLAMKNEREIRPNSKDTNSEKPQKKNDSSKKNLRKYQRDTSNSYYKDRYFQIRDELPVWDEATLEILLQYSDGDLTEKIFKNSKVRKLLYGKPTSKDTIDDRVNRLRGFIDPDRTKSVWRDLRVQQGRHTDDFLAKLEKSVHSDIESAKRQILQANIDIKSIIHFFKI